MNELTTVPVIPNPTGKGGFGDHPEHANPGGKPKHGISYWMGQFLAMPIEDFKVYEKEHSNRTMAEVIAYPRVAKAPGDLKESQEVTNRTDGMPRQVVEMGVDDTITKVKVKIEVSKDGIKSESDNGIRQELPAVSEGDTTNDQPGGSGIEQNLVVGPTVPTDTGK